MKYADDFYIRLFWDGNPGNVTLMYLTALKLQKALGFGKLVHVDLPLFNIEIPDLPVDERIGLHDRFNTNNAQYGYVPVKGFSNIIPNSNAGYINLEGFCQHMENFPDEKNLDYDTLFPCLPCNEGGKEDEIVISIRGGEILEGIHPHYCLIPPEFYEYIINKTNKKPIFYGQLTPSPYLDEIRERFPSATYIPSRGLHEDFDFLRKSKHIILAVSTFSWLAAWLSKATKIYFPVLGTFNPFQHGSMLLPFNDKRYEFYLFPVTYSTHVNQYRSYIDGIRATWDFIDHDTLSKKIPQPDFVIDDYLKALDFMHYIHAYHGTPMYDEVKAIWDRFGSSGIYNHYMESGYFRNYPVCSIDNVYYVEKYPCIAQEMTLGRYKSTLDHYIRRGQYLGLSKNR